MPKIGNGEPSGVSEHHEIDKVAKSFGNVQVLQDMIGDLSGNPSPIEIKLFGEKPTVATAVTHGQLAEDHLAARSGEGLREARREIELALAFFETRPDDAPHLGGVLEVSARVALAEGDRARARRELARAVGLFSTFLGPSAPSLVEARRELARISD